MKTRVFSQEEAVPLFGLLAQESVQVSIAVETSDASLGIVGVGLDDSAQPMDGYTLSSRYPVGLGYQAYLDWIDVRSSLSARTVNFKFALLPEALTEFKVFLGVDGAGRLFEWGKGILKLQYRETIFEWAFHGGRLGSGEVIEALIFKKQKGRWSCFLHVQPYAGSLRAIEKQYRVRHQEVIVPVARAANQVQNESLARLKKLKILAPYLIGAYDEVGAYFALNELMPFPVRCVIVLENSHLIKQCYASGQVATFFEHFLGFSAYVNLEPTIEVLQIGHPALILQSLSIKSALSSQLSDELSAYELSTRIQYGRAIAHIRENVYPLNQGGESKNICSTEMPVWVIWVATKEPDDLRLAEWQLRWASKEPIFWSFIVMTGLKGPIKTSQTIARQGGMGRDFRFFERMRHLEDHVLDNADYCAVNSLGCYTLKELYQVLLGRFALWLEEGRRKGMLKR